MLFINKLFNSIACLLSFTNLQLVIPGRTWILLYLGRTVYKRLWACLALYKNSIQNKTCGRCGLVGHIKKQCREEVYCKFCRNSSHSIRACGTYANFLRVDPVTSSRKNTPEKRTTEDIDCEIAIRVQQEMKRILTDLETN